MEENFFSFSQVSQLLNNSKNAYKDFCEKTHRNHSETLDLTINSSQYYKKLKIPSQIKQILANSVGKVNGYTDLYGIPEIRNFIAQKYSNSEYILNNNEIFLTFGQPVSLFMIFCTMAADPNSNIIIQQFFDPQIKQIAEYFQIEIRSWTSDIQEIEKLIDQNSKFIYLNYPNQYTGLSYSQQQLTSLLDISKKTNIPIIVDETFEKSSNNNNSFISLLKIQEQLLKSDQSYSTVNIILVQDVDTYLYSPGLHLGFVILFGKIEGIFKEIKEGFSNILNSFLMPNTISQANFIELYTSDLSEFQNEYIENVTNNSLLLKQEVNNQQISCLELQEKHPFNKLLLIKINFSLLNSLVQTDQQLVETLFDEFNTKILPGSFFNKNNSSNSDLIIVNLAVKPDIIKRSVLILKEFYQKYMKLI